MAMTENPEPCTGEPPQAARVTVVDHDPQAVRCFELGQPVSLRFTPLDVAVVDFYKVEA